MSSFWGCFRIPGTALSLYSAFKNEIEGGLKVPLRRGPDQDRDAGIIKGALVSLVREKIAAQRQPA